MSKSPKVVSLRGGEIIPPGEPRPNVIELAENILQRAKSGDLMALSAVFHHPDDTFSLRHEGRMTNGTVGAVERLKLMIVRQYEA